jgi:hypothetical protein
MTQMMNFQLAEIIIVWMCAATGATISDEEWDAAYIYLAFVFQKVIQLQVWHIFALIMFSLWFTNI